MTDTIDSETPATPQSFEDLAVSRRAWIDDVLHPWAKQATRKQLLQASAEWLDIAGKVDQDATLWTWAWERFPVLTHPELSGVNETQEVTITLTNGDQHTGYPDSRATKTAQLILLCRNAQTGQTSAEGPFSIDDVADVKSILD